MGESQHERPVLDMRRVKSRETFVYLLDIEVKRARRYQEFFSIILLNLMKSAHLLREIAMAAYYKTLTEVLAKEIRETDILGALAENKIAILLPYANAESAELAQSRINDFLEPYGFKERGCEVEFRRLCFPLDGTNTVDIVKKALDILS